VIIFLLCLLQERESLPEGLFPGTLWISASAFVFLFLISLFRKSSVGEPVISHDAVTIALALIAFVVGGLIWRWPVGVGDFLGSLNVCFFAFGAALAILNGIGWLAGLFIDRSIKANRVKFAVLSCAFLLLLAAFTSLLRDFHAVRLCEIKTCKPAPQFTGWSPIRHFEERPTVREAALAWYQQAEQLYHKDGANKEKPVPMLVIATAGGGIRAALWTATVLERLQEKDKRLQNLVFAISGVSGGSVGAMNYIAALHAREASRKDVKPTEFLQSDFLAPAIASMLFVDGPSNFLPDLGQLDRGTTLERSFEQGSEGYLSYSFLSFFPDKETSKKIWRPALLLNATHQETGRRIIASNIKIERHIFLDSFDEFNLLESDMPASTAAHNSARFTYVSPAGKLVSRGGKKRGYVIDGGYFENYGALTALELALRARREIEKEKGKGKVKLVILQISSDPTLTKDRTRVRTINNTSSECVLKTAEPAEASSNGTANYLRFVDSHLDLKTLRWHNNDGEGPVISYLNELAAPLLGVTAARGARGTLAAAELASAVCELSRESNSTQASTKTVSDTTRSRAEPHFAHLAMCEDRQSTNRSPLGLGLVQAHARKVFEGDDNGGLR
jgi:Patatin-like phospholipase